jgi:hypothetical protein
MFRNGRAGQCVTPVHLFTVSVTRGETIGAVSNGTNRIGCTPQGAAYAGGRHSASLRMISLGRATGKALQERTE